MKTPYEKLKSLLKAHRHLKSGVTFKQLHATAAKISDNETAAALNKARQRLFQTISASLKKCA